MCVSLPGTVVSIRDGIAVVETVGMQRRCNALAYPELEPDDRVLVHAGLVVACSPITRRARPKRPSPSWECCQTDGLNRAWIGGSDGKQLPRVVEARAEPVVP